MVKKNKAGQREAMLTARINLIDAKDCHHVVGSFSLVIFDKFPIHPSSVEIKLTVNGNVLHLYDGILVKYSKSESNFRRLSTTKKKKKSKIGSAREQRERIRVVLYSLTDSPESGWEIYQ